MDTAGTTQNGSGSTSFTQQVVQFLQESGSGQVVSAMSSMQPAFAGAAGFGSGGGNEAPQGGNNFTFSGMNISMGNNMSEEEMAVAIGKRIMAEIRQSFENRG